MLNPHPQIAILGGLFIVCGLSWLIAPWNLRTRAVERMRSWPGYRGKSGASMLQIHTMTLGPVLFLIGLFLLLAGPR
jgi:hypothetical protein